VRAMAEVMAIWNTMSVTKGRVRLPRMMVEEEMKSEGDGDGEVGDMEDGDIRRW
jgi:hypothetical protein